MKRFAAMLMMFASWVQAQGVSLHLDSVPLVEVVKLVYGEIAQREYVLAASVLEARQPVSLYVKDETHKRMIEIVNGMLREAGYQVADSNGVALIDKAKAATEDDDEIIVYRPKHRSARYLADIVQPLTGAKSLLAREFRQVEQQITGAVHPGPKQDTRNQSNQREHNPSSVAGMMDRGEVDQIALSVKPKDVTRLRKLLHDLDTPSGEVLLKAAVYEVGTSREEGSALKLALNISGISAMAGGALANGASIKLSAGGLEAVFSALDSDIRFKSISRPQVRVKNGAMARFSVGQDVPVIAAQQIDRNGNPLNSVEYKQSGIILTAKPEIREETIELDLSQELSNFVVTSTGVNGSPTLIKRAVNTRMSLLPGEIVILAGLQADSDDGQRERLPFLGWLIGQKRQQQQSEIIVFIEAQRI